MKSTKQILSSIVDQPQFGSLSQHHCYRKFMALLPPRFQKAVAFVYVKNKTLFMALSHPGYKMELNYNKELFKDLLVTLIQYAPECRDYHADKVVLFQAKYHNSIDMEAEAASQTIPYYSELSSGEFDLALEEGALLEKFQHTKTLIKKMVQTEE